MKLRIAFLAFGFLSNVHASDTLDSLATVASVEYTINDGVMYFTDCVIDCAVRIPERIKRVVFIRSVLEKKGMIIFDERAKLTKSIVTLQIPAQWERIFERNPGIVQLREDSKIEGRVLNGSIDDIGNQQAKL